MKNLDLNSTQFLKAVQLKIIDQKRLLELFELDDGSTEFAANLIADFTLEQVDFFNGFTIALHRQDRLALGRTAHKMKSSLANIAAQRAAQICEEIERKVKLDMPVDDISVLVKHLKLEVELFLNAVSF